MSNQISITTSHNEQQAAAASLSEILRSLNCPHAYIGGFALSLLGSDRSTEIYVLIELEGIAGILALRDQISKLDRHFVSFETKFYFVKDVQENLDADQFLGSSKDSVLLEILQAGTLGLPTEAGPIYTIQLDSGASLPILNPSVLIHTKIQWWYTNHPLFTRPKTIAKNNSDLSFLVYWLAENEMTTRTDWYKGKSEVELLFYLQEFRTMFREDVDLMEALEKAMEPKDWDQLDHTDVYQVPCIG